MQSLKKSVKILLIISCISSSMVYSVFGYADALAASSPAAQSAAITELLDNSNHTHKTMSASPAFPASVASPALAPVANTQPLTSGNQSSASNAADNSFGATSTSRTAFSNVVKNLMPMSPTQIQTLRKMYDNSRKAAATFPGTPPKSTSTTVLVNLSPGASPPVIRLRAGFISSLIFLDSTGQPWPIQAYDNGDPQAFNIQWDQASNPSTLLVQSSGGFKTGNFAVLLKGNPTPIMLTLVPGQKAVDYRVDLRVPGLGPNASLTMGSMPSTVTPQLLDVLNGVPPASAKRLTVTGGDVQAWSLNGHMYVRTRLTLLSPSWTSTMSSPDGTHAYELMNAPVLLASNHGNMVHLTVKGL